MTNSDVIQIKGKKTVALLCFDGIYLTCYRSICPVKKHSTTISTKFLWLITFIAWWNIYILMRVVSTRTNPPSTGHEGSPNGLMSIKMLYLICYDHHSHPISTQLNTFERFCIDMLGSALHHYHQNTDFDNIYWMNGIQSSSTVPETFKIYVKDHWSCSSGLTSYLVTVFNHRAVQTFHRCPNNIS